MKNENRDTPLAVHSLQQPRNAQRSKTLRHHSSWCGALLEGGVSVVSFISHLYNLEQASPLAFATPLEDRRYGLDVARDLTATCALGAY
jgi:hypothetical protein